MTYIQKRYKKGTFGRQLGGKITFEIVRSYSEEDVVESLDEPAWSPLNFFLGWIGLSSLPCELPDVSLKYFSISFQGKEIGFDLALDLFLRMQFTYRCHI